MEADSISYAFVYLLHSVYAVTVGPQQCPGSMLVSVKLPELALVNISRRGIIDPPALTHTTLINGLPKP